jgi:SAM-dependent methyltransferase
LRFYGSDNIRCPFCNSLPRQRFQCHLIRETRFGSLEHADIIHFAPEYSLSRFIRKNRPNRYVRADGLVSFIPGICVKPDIIVDLTGTKLRSESFDILICNHVLEHVNDDRTAICEIHRILRPHGTALISVPISVDSAETLEDKSINTPALRLKHYGSEDHVRLYAMDIVDRFRAAGFDVEVRRPRNLLTEEQMAREMLEPDEPHFVLSKTNAGAHCRV